MERELARHVIKTGFHSLSVLDSLIPLLREHCQPPEFDQYLKAIASISAEMSLEIFNKIFQQYPDLKGDVENQVKKYGQFI